MEENKSKIKVIEVEGEKVYLKKNTFFKGYRIVNPIKINPEGKFEKGNINYVNLLFGGWPNLVKTTILFAIIILVSYSYYHDNYALVQALNTCNANKLLIVNSTFQPMNFDAINLTIVP